MQTCYGPGPVSLAARLSPETAGSVPLSAGALALDKLNAKPENSWDPYWNPFLNYKTDEQDQSKLQARQLMSALVGPFQQPGEMFQAKALIPVRDIVAGLVAQRSPAEQDVLAPVLAGLPPAALLRTPAHQFNVDGRPDNRILFYSDDAKDQAALKALVEDLGRQHKRVVVQWMHMSDADLSSSPQGGTLQDILGGKLKFGSSHVHAYSTGCRTVGSDVTLTLVTSNWGDNSRLDDRQTTYAVHLFAIDYQAGAHDLIPDETLAAYKRNADMWDCMAALHVKFSSAGDTFGYSSYAWNPLEIHDRSSARDIARKLADDWDTFADKHGSFYCAEAQYSIACLGPQEDTLLKESLFGNTKLGKLIKAYGEAPGYRGKPIAWCRQNPHVGWQHLASLGAAGGGLERSWLYPLLGDTSENFEGDTYSNRQTVFLEFIPEHIKGWQAYRPRNKSEMIATPMSTGMVTWALMHQYLPTEGITVLLVRELIAAYTAGDAKVKVGITALAGGADPLSKLGQVALAIVASQLAAGFVLASLQSKDGVQKLGSTETAGFSQAELDTMSFAQIQMLKTSGYGEITNEADRAKVRNVWDQFILTMKNPANWTLDQLRAALHAVDAQASMLEVERKTPSGALVKGLMHFVPPGSWGFWAQHPDFCQSYAVTYVATGLHRNLAKASASRGSTGSADNSGTSVISAGASGGGATGPFEQRAGTGPQSPGQTLIDSGGLARAASTLGPAAPVRHLHGTFAAPRNEVQIGESRATDWREGLIWLGTRLGAFGFGLAALCVGAVALYWGASDVKLLLSGTRLDGKVAALVEHDAKSTGDRCVTPDLATPPPVAVVPAQPAPAPVPGPDAKTDQSAAPKPECRSVAPAVRFTDRSGRAHCHVRGWYACPAGYTVGQDVSVLVDDPAAPNLVRLDGGFLSWLWTALMGAFAAIMGFVGWMMRPSAETMAKLGLDPPIDDGMKVVSLAEFRRSAGMPSRTDLPRLHGIALSAGLVAKGEIPLDLCELCSYMSALVYERIRDDGRDTAKVSAVEFLNGFPGRPFTHVTPFWNENTEALGFVLDGAAFVVLRGTADWADWKGNLDAGKTAPAELLPPGMTSAPPRHRGFAKAWAAISPQLRAWLDTVAPSPATPVIITGHSLGGALSFLAAWELKSLGRNVAGVFTFGAALPGDSGFAEAYKTLGLYDRTLQLEFTQDIVPEAQKLVGYVPVGRVWEPKQLPFTSHTSALAAIPLAWFLTSLSEGLFKTKKAEPEAAGSTASTGGDAKPAPADTRPFSEQARSWIRKLIVFAFFSSLLALAAHKMQRRYGLALSVMSYRKIREQRLLEARIDEPTKASLTTTELAECYEAMRHHLLAIRGTPPDNVGVYSTIPNLPCRLADPTAIRFFNAFFPSRSW